jgi:CheY-like chemotaxis protein
MRGALKIWRACFGRGFTGSSGKPPLPSLLRAMDALVPRKVIREVVSSSHDRRQWGTLAAAWVGVSEREFYRAAAAEMKISFHEHVHAPDLSPFGPHARKVLGELRRIGASALLEGARIRTLICVDPSEVRGSSLFTESPEIALASWTEILRALDSCERGLRDGEAQGLIAENSRKKELCLSALTILMGEAKAHGASTFDIVTNDGRTRYQFYTSHGKLAVGAVHPDVVGDLLHLLREADGSTIELKDGMRVLLRGFGSGADFKVSAATDRERPSHSVAAHRGVDVSTREEPRLMTASPQNARAEQEVGEGSVCGSGEPVLIVDDNPMFCRILQKLLVRDGFAPSFAGNGVEAFEKLVSGKTLIPKIIVCDLHMPIMNGREFISRVKDDARFRAIPVVVLTSDEDVEAELQLLQSGADTFISKAKDPRVLTSHLKRLLSKSGEQEAA